MVTSPKESTPLRLAIIVDRFAEVSDWFVQAVTRVTRMNLMAVAWVVPGGHPAL
jgi:hypothetical protein